MATMDVYEFGNPTKVGTLAPAAGDWVHRANEHGAGRALVNGDVAAALLASDVYVRVNDGTRDVFSWLPTGKPRRQVGVGTEVDLSGPGLRWLLTRALVYPADTSDCARPTDVRWEGWMSAAYSAKAALWDDAVAYGTWRDQATFFTVPPIRAAGLAAPLGQFITSATGPVQNGTLYFYKQKTATETLNLLAQFAGDDEYRLFINGVPVIDTIGGGPYQWTDVQEVPVPVCEGQTYTVGIELRNTGGNVSGDNPAHVIGALVHTAGDGRPAAGNHIVEISNDAEDGTITIRSLLSEYPNPVTVNHDDTGTAVQAALEAEFGVGNVTAAGAGTSSKNEAYHTWSDATGGTFTFTIGASTSNDIAHNASAATIKAEVEAVLAAEGFVGDVTVTVVGAGTVADPWETNFSGDAVDEQTITMSADFTNLTGQTVAEHENIQDGAPLDPWRVEWTGLLANLQIPLVITDDLSGGEVTDNTVQVGGGAQTWLKTDETWKVLAFPADVPGLTPHEILEPLISEEQARGNTRVDHLTLSSTATLDTDGNTWSEVVLEIPLENGSIDRVVELLIEAGFKFDMQPTFVLDGWETRGTDRTATVAYTVGDGSNVIQADHDETALVNVLRSLSDEGWDEIPDAASITTYGRAGGTLRLDAYDPAGAGQFTPALLADLKVPQEPVALEVPAEHAVLPYDDFVMADETTAPAWGTAGLTPSTVRWLEIAGRIVGASHVWTLRGTT